MQVAVRNRVKRRLSLSKPKRIDTTYAFDKLRLPLFVELLV
jgi:hypothetical protein